MPRWFGWAWPILNPLFWMIFGKLWCKKVTEKAKEMPVELPALPQPSFPEPLPEPQIPLYRPKIQPDLVIGLGEAGEWILCRLKNRLLDRKIESGEVEVVQI